MKKNNLLLLLVSLSFFCLFNYKATSQISFSNANSALHLTTFRSGGPVTVIDWNNDGRDDIVRMFGGHRVYIEIQRPDGNFDSLFIADFGGGPGWAWAMAVADVDENGYKDIIAGGYGGPGVQIMRTSAAGLLGTVDVLPSSGFFLQNMTMADFNNDGQIDLFACDDNAESHIYLNSGGVFTLSTGIINFDVTPTDDSGNYGSVWSDVDNDGDMDLYIAKCRQSVTSPLDGRRIDVVFRNDSGVFTEAAASFGLANGWQTWTASFGDIDNDGDNDLMVTNHDHESQILTNDGSGHYTDITASTGFNITDITPIQSVMEDFDNDGFVDILASGSSSRMYRNNGTGTFTRVDGIFDGNNMLSFAIGDLNHDGFIDLYSSYGDIYVSPSAFINDVYWKNAGNSNHFISLHLEGVASNKDAIGTKVKIYGPWGVQVREVKCGESYGTINSGVVHFGLGMASHIDSVTIAWPSGTKQTILTPSIDQFITVKEGECISPEAIITSSGPFIICPGSTVRLTAPAGCSYHWSNDSTSRSITTGTTGFYNVSITAPGNNCVGISRSIFVGPPADETPTITASGDLLFCDGGEVILTATPGYATYNWTGGGSTSATDTITSSGTYTVTINGVCNPFTSAPITVDVISALPPMVHDTSYTGPGMANLFAGGTNINWYRNADGTDLLAAGNYFTTPILHDTTQYYVQSFATFGGTLYDAGISNASSAGYSGSTATNALTFFDVLKPCTLESVKVYTNLDGIRKIELRDSANTLLNSTIISLVGDSQVVHLNWSLTPGINYTISTDSATNKAIPSWGYASPCLKRQTTGVTYPYLASDLLSITNSSFGPIFYYYFYDWKVQDVFDTCYSAIVPISVNVNEIDASITALDNNLGLSIYPNPASTFITIKNNYGGAFNVSIYDISGRLLMEENSKQANTIIDISKLASGIYSIYMTKEGQKTNTKLVIQ
jgi:ASPIC and UnbV/Secretion system C-terminal sorting domain/FG-GAP-like repeat/Ig-like domain CHU_C associated